MSPGHSQCARLSGPREHVLCCLALHKPGCLTMQVDVYDGTTDFLRKLELDEDALTKAIIGTIGDIDSYQLPDAKGYTAFLRHILGVTDEERQQRREQILGTTLKDFRCRRCACFIPLLDPQRPRVWQLHRHTMLSARLLVAQCQRTIVEVMSLLAGLSQHGVNIHAPWHRSCGLTNVSVLVRRAFADYVSVVADPQHARVVAVTSPERAAAAQEERPGFFDEVTKVL